VGRRSLFDTGKRIYFTRAFEGLKVCGSERAALRAVDERAFVMNAEGACRGRALVLLPYTFSDSLNGALVIFKGSGHKSREPGGDAVSSEKAAHTSQVFGARFHSVYADCPVYVNVYEAWKERQPGQIKRLFSFITNLLARLEDASDAAILYQQACAFRNPLRQDYPRTLEQQVSIRRLAIFHINIKS
jgi:hypothetical protein